MSPPAERLELLFEVNLFEVNHSILQSRLYSVRGYAHSLVLICRSAVAIANYFTMLPSNMKDIFTLTAFAAVAHRVVLITQPRPY